MEIQEFLVTQAIEALENFNAALTPTDRDYWRGAIDSYLDAATLVELGPEAAERVPPRAERVAQIELAAKYG